ncbi:MAG: DUF4330 family protein [Clostridia bacterium]|nr:DUF4330 family protein [Clostridia bacterium]
MENKTLKKRKFNAIDAVILLVIVAAVGVAVFLFSSEEVEMPMKKVKLEYVVEIKALSDDIAAEFNIGDKMVDSVQKYNLGEIIAVEYDNAVYYGKDIVNGKSTAYDYPDHQKVTLTMLADATLDSNGRYLIDGGYDISTGTTVYIRLPGFNGIGYCTAFSKPEVTE